MDANLETIVAGLWAELVSEDTVPWATDITVTGSRGYLPSRHPVEDAAAACVAVALQAGAALARVRGQAPLTVAMDLGHVAASMQSTAFFRWKGQPTEGMAFAPLSRFWAARDGWVRTHANYPWHARALLRVLGTPSDPNAVASRVAAWSAADLEQAVFAAGGVASAVRTPDAWRQHPQATAVRHEPVVDQIALGAAAPRPPLPPAELPAAGLKVLDLTRVIAGPVCTRYLAALGAAVVRLDPPHHPDLPDGVPADTLLGKRSAGADFSTPEGAAVLDALLTEADIIVTGYRPGALDRFGLSPATLARRHPGIVIVSLAAWGHTGPWAPRRGFDSIVQAATGIAWREGGESGSPGALPCQLLDHATGYLAAAAALDGVRRQRTRGGTHLKRLSLARTAHWLQALPSGDDGRDASAPDANAADWLVNLADPSGEQQALRPIGQWGERWLTWRGAAAHYLADKALWPEND